MNSEVISKPLSDRQKHRAKTVADTAKRFRELLDQNKAKDEQIAQLQAELNGLRSGATAAPAKETAPAPPVAEWYLGWAQQHLARRTV